MGVGSRRPPLPAPTDISSANDNDNETDINSALGVSDDLATNISHVSDKTHWTIPEDGTPVTITTKKNRDPKKESSTSLLIEYFEGNQAGEAPTSRPSLRVRVTPSASKRSKKGGRDHIQISETRKSGRPTAVRRISLPGRDSESVDFSSASDVSSTRPPVDIEVFHSQEDYSEVGAHPHAHLASDVSSMPPDSMLDVPIRSKHASPKKRRSEEKEKISTKDSLQAPERSGSLRSKSRERIAQRALEKIQKDPGVRVRESSSRRKSSAASERSSRSRSVSKELLTEEVLKSSSKSRSSKHRDSSKERNLHPSEISVISSRSAASGSSINNPKLLNAVEDAIKKLILPELIAVKEEQKAMKNRQKFEDMSRTSSTSRREDERRISKTSSLPSVSGKKPEIIADDRGVILSERRRTSRRSSRESVSERGEERTARDSHSRRRSSGERKSTKEAALAGGIAGAAIMGLAGALGHKSSSSTLDKERKKRRSKSQSRSRGTSVSEHRSEHHSEHFDHDLPRNAIPPLPMQSNLDSELTRDSILSADTERPSSRLSSGQTTPVKIVRQVSRGSAGEATRSPTWQSTEHKTEDYVSRDLPDSRGTVHSSTGRAGISAAPLGAAAAAAFATALHHKRSRDHLTTPPRHFRGTSPGLETSPTQSESSLAQVDDIAEHPRVRSIRSTHSLSSERKGRKSASPVSAHSSPGMNISKKRPDAVHLQRSYEILPEDEYSPQTPRGDDLEQWLEREHQENDRYREQYDRESLLTADVDHHRDTMYTEDSLAEDYVNPIASAQHVRYIDAKPQYIHTPPAVESAVGSLQEASAISVHSSDKSSPTKRLPVSQSESLSLEDSYHPPPNNKPLVGSKQRWEEVRDRAMAMTSRMESPAQSETQSIDEGPILGATYVPVPHDIPEIGIVPDDESEVITNPSMIEEKLGGPNYQPTPKLSGGSHSRDAALLGAGAAAVGLGLAAQGSPDVKRAQYQPSVEELEDVEYEQYDHESPMDDLQKRDYVISPTHTKDEGYISANHPMSPVPNPIPRDVDIDGYSAQYNDDFDDDPFMTEKQLKHASGLSHGMATPLYDSATGKGMERIESKDIVALMDHLTVRDAQRNARDTEILVTLVRSAAEMRNNFEDMKRFILEQDQLIMSNMDRGNDTTVQRATGGARTQATGSPKTPKRTDDAEDLTTKRRNVFRRALKGLSMRSNNDFGKIEDMLNQLLSEVEGLKDAQTYNGASQPPTQTASLNSYEHLRAVPDPGYEPEGRAGTNSSPAQSGFFSNPSSRHLMHSGYDGRRASEGNRISTVHEDDEEADEPAHAPRVRYADPGTPTKTSRVASMHTPPDQTGGFQSYEPTPKTDKSRSKHKSGSSIFGGFPRISRWSKTTTSTVPDDVRYSSAKKDRPYSEGSRSGSNLQLDYDYDYDEDDRHRSQGSFEHDVHMSGANRAASPLIPEYELDDPKYQAHRNSQNLQHPQPRPGPTHRHGNHLEREASEYNNPATPDTDYVWGSEPALAKGRYTNERGEQRLSPLHSEDGDSQHSASEEVMGYHRQGRGSDDGPLVPPKIPFSSSEPSYTMYGVPMMNSGMHIASPLEPIEEVRKSLETDRSSIRPEMTPSPRPMSKGINQRKPAGPREMPRTASSSSRRRQVSSQDPPDSPVSYETYRTSLDSVTF